MNIDPNAVTTASDIRDIKGPLDLPSIMIYFIYAALFILFIAGLFYLAKYLLKRGRLFAAPPKKPHELAYERLKALKEKNYVGQGKYKEYFFELSLIVRYYLEDRFSLKAPEMTTEEFIAKLKDTKDLEYETKNILRNFLSYCDLVKFAKHGPAEQDAEDSYNSACMLIDNTTPQESQEEKKETKPGGKPGHDTVKRPKVKTKEKKSGSSEDFAGRFFDMGSK